MRDNGRLGRPLGTPSPAPLLAEHELRRDELIEDAIIELPGELAEEAPREAIGNRPALSLGAKAIVRTAGAETPASVGLRHSRRS